MSLGRWTVALLAAATLGALGCDTKGNGASSAGPGPGPASTKPAGASVTEWKVGAYLSLSGEDADFGVFTKDGIELAVDEINKAGGVKQKSIKVLYED